MRKKIFIIFLNLIIFLMPLKIHAQIGPIIHNIIVDQFGYRPDADKYVIFADPQVGQYSSLPAFNPGASFQVRRQSDDTVMFTGTPAQWNGGATDASSGDAAWHGDFSAFTTPGEYYISVPGGTNSNACSYTFKISSDVYNPLLQASARTFFYQRCGCEISSEHGGNWNHSACHQNANQDTEANLMSGTDQGQTRNLWGGWHDAGDYGKYIVVTHDVLWNLMTAWEWYPENFSDDTNIPESGNGVPDILDEVKYELDWMLRMQFPDGSLSAKIQPSTYEPYSPPESSPDQRFYSEPSTDVTAVGAAMFAMASRIFANYNSTYPGYANTLRTAAEDAWNFLESNSGQITHNHAGFAGADFNVNFAVERQLRVAAAAELFRLTGDATYRTYFDNNYNNANTSNGYQPILNNAFDANGSCLAIERGMVSYCLAPGATPGVVNAIRTTLRNGADWFIINAINSDPYRSYIQTYVWGSNSVHCSYASMALWAAELDVSPADSAAYRAQAEEFLHYIHGRNPLNLVYLTNTGSKGLNAGADNCIMEIFHRWFGDGTALYDGESSTYGTAPGIMSGGPNPFFSPDGSYSGPPIEPPGNEPDMKSYLDWNTDWPENSWEVTENSIAFQGRYTFLVAAFSTEPTQQSSPQNPSSPNDTTAPVISDIRIVNRNKNRTIITWTTDEDATSQVEYGFDTNYGFISDVDSNLVTNHSITISGLSAGTEYHYRVISVDAANNSAISSDSTFTTSEDEIIVTSYPNPYEYSASNPMTFDFSGVSIQSTLKIYSISGKLVKTIDLSANQTTLRWDGKDETGSVVASGLYLYVLTTSEGKIKKGKFAFIK